MCRVCGRCKSRCWNRCQPPTKDDFGSLFSVSAPEWYNSVSGHRQWVSVIGSVTRRLGSPVYFEVCRRKGVCGQDSLAMHVG